MHPFRYHVFACEQRKPDGLPCCHANGSQAVIDALRREIATRGLFDTVAVTTAGSMGMCANGPNLVVYPEGVFYSHVTPADVPEIVTEHFQNGRPVARLMRTDEAATKAEIAENRGKALAMMKAKDAAGVVPDDLAEMVRGYMASRVALTAIELGVFTKLAAAPLEGEALAKALSTDPHATTVLADALVALGLLAKKGGAYENAPVAARFLVAGAKDDASTALAHNLSLWETWSTLTEVVRTGNPADRPDMDARGDAWTTPFIAAMHKNAGTRAPAVVNAVGVAGVKRMIDIGGGSGAYAIAFAKASETLEADVLDLATVTPIARGHIAAAGLAERVRTKVGDLRADALGEGYDLALLSAICHMLGPDENADLLKRVFAALAPGGRVVIQDHVMAPEKTAPRAGALFAINMLVGTPHGGTYSEAEYTAWLRDAGFADVKRVKLPGGPNELVIGTKGA
jgi:(2Fe-2S) ferredoxin/SAM-dependent methyltransferase